ncbi:hypothetical protein [Methylobacterium soli]|uniref:Uncharacterized protein n=1 Tax=Methylobacterium soli TaxID=553447 RepID=A0A6L3SXT2_9HYPH|nr:hypothetical protein [Methylobacterium soli]KAB1078322.1 hypothetical protein F6X53_14600 [Methylobacterium soli]GJE44476.1 hypothetical protein AEGHOMDF_3664 [Methylobacterium soli]
MNAYFLFADRIADPTMSFVVGAAAIVLGTGFFGFFASRFPCFFSVAMMASSGGRTIIAQVRGRRRKKSKVCLKLG